MSSERQSGRKIADELEKYFSQRLAEREKESETNKAFHLSSKEFVYICTVQGHEPVIEFPNEG